MMSGNAALELTAIGVVVLVDFKLATVSFNEDPARAIGWQDRSHTLTLKKLQNALDLLGHSQPTLSRRRTQD